MSTSLIAAPSPPSAAFKIHQVYRQKVGASRREVLFNRFVQSQGSGPPPQKAVSCPPSGSVLTFTRV